MERLTSINQLKFEQLHEEYHKFMMHTAMGVLRDVHLAGDAVQNAFVRLMKAPDKIGVIPSDQTRGYLYKVVRSAAFDIIRQRSKLSEKEVYDADDEMNEIADPAVGILESIVSRGDFKAITEAFGKLSEKLQSVAYLAFVKKMPYKEMAQVLGVGESAVKMRVKRAREILVGLLEGGDTDGNNE